MKSILAFAALLFASEAKAYFLFNIPVVSLAQVNAESPITEMHELCEHAQSFGTGIGGAGTSFGWGWKNCMRIAYRPDAEYGQKFLVIMPESSAKALFEKRPNYKDQFNPYDSIPNPIQIVAVPDSDYRISDGPIPYPPDGYLTKTDPEIGKKMLFCSASGVACAISAGMFSEVLGIWKTATYLNFCISKSPGCQQFRDAWIREHKALQEMDDWNVAHGMTRTPFETWYREVIYPGHGPSGTGEGSGAPPTASGGFPEGGVLTEHCYSSVVTVGNGPLGEKTEYPDTTCYYF